MPKKVAILVPNPCDPDFRVIKQAEFFAKLGAEVRVFCRAKAGLPSVEMVNGVTYVRRSMVSARLVFVLHEFIAKSLRSIVAILAPLKIGAGREEDLSLAEARARNRAIIDQLVVNAKKGHDL